ncbi:MAG: hypothetical protein AAF610_11225, partial [Pseudomonadota bacterium]
MATTRRRACLWAALTSAVLASPGLPGCAEPADAPIRIEQIRLSDAPPSALSRAAYLTLHNDSGRAR